MNTQLLLAATKAQLLLGATDAKGRSTNGFSGILHNISNTIQSWGDYVLLFVGIILIAYGALALFKAIKGLGDQQGGGGGMVWAKAVLAIIIGIVLCVTRVSDIRNNDKINNNTVKDALNGEG